MRVSVRLSRPLCFRRLSLPFDLRCHVERGVHVFEIDGRKRHVGIDGTVRIRAWTRFDYLAVPHVTGSASASWSIDVKLLPFVDANLLQSVYCGVARALSQQVFCNPGHAWRATEVAKRLGFNEHRLRALLFRQNDSFTRILLRHRLMRVMLGLMDSNTLVENVFSMSGMRDAKQIANALASEFDVHLIDMVSALPVTSISGSSLLEREPIHRQPQGGGFCRSKPICYGGRSRGERSNE
jgi:hypothetical protein